MNTPYSRFSDCLYGVDARVAEMERKWGIGRLRMLVSQPTRERFDMAQAMWRKSVEACQASKVMPEPLLAELEAHAAMMMRAWAAVDAEATQAGQKPLQPEWWEVQPDDPADPVICLTRTLQEAHAVAAQAKAEGRLVTVWSLCEVGRVIKAQSLASSIKAMWPGAQVQPSARIRTESQAMALPPLFDDAIPFGEEVEA